MTTKDTNRSLLWHAPIICSLMLGAGIAHASPEGGDVVEGEADIDYGDWARVLTGEITIIDWISFNIAAGETVEFIMPGADSRVLNRITSGTPTEIMGNLIGNGQIFIVNPAGVIFGQGAVVNVGALYAAAGNINNTDFVNGLYRFTDARGVVENRGLLQGDLIALVGGRVANHGTISAPGGTVVMAAGEQVLIGEHLGHIFVQLERPTDLENTDLLDTSGLPGLSAGDVYSLAAWNTGTIESDSTTIAVSAGHMAIDNDLSAGELTLIADGDAHIELAANLHSDGLGVFLEGDVQLNEDVSITSTGGLIAFKGSVDSQSGEHNDLLIDASTGTVRLSEAVGMSEAGRLGTLDVTAGLVRIFDDIRVNDQMNFYAPVSISGQSTTFDVGMGTALFADRIFSSIDGRSDVAFVYDGQAWVGQGEARTPYQFRAGIGVGTQLSSTAGTGAFRNITFGGDLSDPSRVSAFLFGTGAMAGLELMNSADVDLGYRFSINARESIVMGHGQKMVSFGSLSLGAKGNGITTIAVGDLNVLGDLRIASEGRAGGRIIFNTRAPGEIDWTGNEIDRDLDGLFDDGLELIASGDITLVGDITTDGPVRLGGSSVSIYNNSGTGDAGGLTIDTYPGGVSLELFAGLLSGTTDLLYPYDLTLPPAGEDTDDSQANLARALDDEAPLRLRTDSLLLAAREILTELGFNPTDPASSELRNANRSGAERYLDGGVGTTNDASAFGFTIDRLNRSSVERLARAYTDLLGQRTGTGTERERDTRVQKAIVQVWLHTTSEYRDFDDLIARGMDYDPGTREILRDLRRTLIAIELLELTPREIDHARRTLMARITPASISPDELIERWFLPEPTPFAIDRD